MTEGARIHTPGQLPQFNPEEGPDTAWAIHYNTSDQPDYVEKTVSGITYRRTITWAGNLVTAVSEWVKQ